MLKEINGSHTILYFYDGLSICSIQVDGQSYFLRRNLFQDVTHIYDLNGNLVASYLYDAWGNHQVFDASGVENTNADFIGNINPIRYRGYYFDVETNLYYLNSRYYDPEVGRFISLDAVDYLAPDSIHGLNLFAYCFNNPIMYADPSGHFVISALLASLIGATLLSATISGTVSGGVSAAKAGGNFGDVLKGMGKGFINGLVFGGAVSLALIGGFAVGSSTILGSFMVNYGICVTANMLEVSFTQNKKSTYDGDNMFQTKNDINNAMFANLGRILFGNILISSTRIFGTRIFSKIPTAYKVSTNYLVDNLLYSTSFVDSAKSTLLKDGNKVGLAISYFFTAKQVYDLFKSIISTPDFENSKWILY